MRAALVDNYGDPSVVRTGEAEEPLVGPDSVLVRVEAAGVNPVDWKIVAGYLREGIPHHLPLVPGWDVAGVVESTGPAVTEVEAGDRVIAYDREDHVQFGTFAEKVAVPIRTVARMPDGLDFVHGAALPLAGLTAGQLVEAAGVASGDMVLVHAAAGGVGGLAGQLSLTRGAYVVGTAGAANQDYLRGRGIVPVTYGRGLVDAVLGVEPSGVDVVIDLVGGEAFAATGDLLADGGRVVSVVEPEQAGELGGRYVFVRPDASMLARLAGMVASDDLEVDVAEQFPLERAAEALQTSKDGHVRGKVVITVG